MPPAGWQATMPPETQTSFGRNTMLHQPAQSAATRPSSSALLAWFHPRVALRRAYAANRALTLLGVLMLITLVVSIAGLLIDPRVITGVPAWIKPAKFAISITLYSFTLLWLLSYV